MTLNPDTLPPLNWLRSFEASARLGSFTAAAGEINITQSAVSQQIKLLEARLGETLFIRSSRKLRLTEAGLNYVYFVREAFDLLRIGTRSVFDEDRGRSLTLRANLAFTLFWLMPHMSDLYERHPWINLNILPHIWDSDERHTKFSIEILIGINYAEQGLRPLGDESFFPVCAPKLLKDDTLYTAPHFDSPGMTANWDQWHKSRLSDLERKPVNYASTVVVSLNAAINGVGLAIAHTTLTKSLESSGVIVRPFEGTLPMQERYFITDVREQDQTPAIRCFIEWIEELRENGSVIADRRQ